MPEKQTQGGRGVLAEHKYREDSPLCRNAAASLESGTYPQNKAIEYGGNADHSRDMPGSKANRHLQKMRREREECGVWLQSFRWRQKMATG